jgi:hypothetical protein
VQEVWRGSWTRRCASFRRTRSSSRLRFPANDLDECSGTRCSEPSGQPEAFAVPRMLLGSRWPEGPKKPREPTRLRR